MIQAGTRAHIGWGDGNWIFLDIGFSANLRSSGLLVGNEMPVAMQYGEARHHIVDHVKRAKSPTCLVVEAPLSVSFNSNGNPTGRLIEKRIVEGKTTHRYWYEKLGCSVMVAAMYLFRSISEEAPDAHVCLFEGFVSYKDRTLRSDHCADAELLREVVKDPHRFKKCIIEADALARPGHRIISAFDVCGGKCGVPTVIKREAQSV